MIETPRHGQGGTTYGVDAIGDITKIDRSGTANDWVWGYDAYGRMSCAKATATAPCSTATGGIAFASDALDRTYTRTKSGTGGTTTTLTYQGLGEVPAKTVAGASTTTYANTLGGSPMAQKTSNAASIRFFLTDPHGDVVGLATTGATVQGTTSYDPWGSRLGSSGTESAFVGYQGDMTDADSKQVDMGTRWYEPSLGRFSSRDVLLGDPMQLPSLNMFAYAGANPITMIDPTGMCTIDVCPWLFDGKGPEMSDVGEAISRDMQTRNVPVVGPIMGPAPAPYGDFLTDHATAIGDASNYFNVPRSVIASVLYAEFEDDQGSVWHNGAGNAGCSLVPIGSLGFGSIRCDRLSPGVAQLQLRRSALEGHGFSLDGEVRMAMVHSSDPGLHAKGLDEYVWGTRQDQRILRLMDLVCPRFG